MMDDESYHPYYVGDNLEIMKRMKDKSINLIATDPPYNSGRDFGAFRDIWDRPVSWLHCKSIARLSNFIANVHSVNMANYISFLGIRMLEMKRLLKPEGSIYLQCDDSSVHYIKMLMDSVFGKNQFRNEIVWHRYDSAKGTKHRSRKFPRNNDRILFYSKTNDYYYHPLYHPVIESDTTSYNKDDNDGRGKYKVGTLENPKPGGYYYDYKGYKTPRLGYRCPIQTMIDYDILGMLHYPKSKGSQIYKKRFLYDFKGKQIDDNWNDIKGMYACQNERIGYPTQKPIALYERIILSGCPTNGVVLDPFAGSGTTGMAAWNLGYDFILIDELEKESDKVMARFHEKCKDYVQFIRM